MHNGNAHAPVELERVVAASRFRYRSGICICPFSGLSSVLLVVLSECRAPFLNLLSFFSCWFLHSTIENEPKTLLMTFLKIFCAKIN